MKHRKNIFPVFVVEETYLFPGFSEQLTVGKPKSLATISVAGDKFENQFLLVNRDLEQKSSEDNSFFSVGVFCSFRIEKKLSNGILINVRSHYRVKILNSFEENKLLYAQFEKLIDQQLTKEEKHELADLISKILKKTSSKTTTLSAEHFLKNDMITEFFNLVLQHYPDNTNNFKQKCLATNNLFLRYRLVTENIKFEPLKNLGLSKLIDRNINRRVKDRLSNQQREFYLREKLRAIREELGETDPRVGEVNRYFKRLEKEPFPEHVKQRLQEELERYQALPPMSGESGLIKNYID